MKKYRKVVKLLRNKESGIEKKRQKTPANGCRPRRIIRLESFILHLRKPIYTNIKNSFGKCNTVLLKRIVIFGIMPGKTYGQDGIGPSDTNKDAENKRWRLRRNNFCNVHAARKILPAQTPKIRVRPVT